MTPQTNTPIRYEPTKYYIDVDNQGEHDINHTEEVIIGLEQGTTFPTRVGTTSSNAKIDTSATRCCMSEEYYKKLQLSKLHLLQNVSVRSATGSNLTPVGLVNYTFMLGDTSFDFHFKLCKIPLDPSYWEEIF